MKRHGWTNTAPYIEDPISPSMGWVHVDTPDRAIVREIYRRLHSGEVKSIGSRPLAALPRVEIRQSAKRDIRYLLERHHANQQEYRNVMYPLPATEGEDE